MSGFCCTGFIYALSIADKFIRLSEAKCALVIGAECLSRLVDWNDRATCVLFGDGAGAVVLGPSEQPGNKYIHRYRHTYRPPKRSEIIYVPDCFPFPDVRINPLAPLSPTKSTRRQSCYRCKRW
jgi:3-oxoacyl-[acyl-carrier-protein] synthase III